MKTPIQNLPPENSVEASSGGQAPRLVSWVWEGYPSGTQVVISNRKGKPHFYVTATAAIDDDRGRYATAVELQSWLNGGDEPWWLDLVTFKDYSDTQKVVLPNGVTLLPTGPMYDRDAPMGGNWAEVKTSDAQIERGLLIQAIREKRIDLLS